MPKRSKIILWIAFLSGIFFQSVYGQAGWVEIDTNHREAFVYADTTWLGTAETGIFRVPEGSTDLILVPNSVDTWSIPSIARALTGNRSDTLRLDVRFPHYYRIESVPSGVDVYVADSGVREFLGTTPLDYSTEEFLDGELLFDKPGYVSRNIMPGTELWNRHLVLLESVQQMDPVAVSGVAPLRASSSWLDYVAIGTSITGALLAVHYKTKADRLYDEYKESRDFGLKPDIDQYDLYSGIALGAMQVGLGVLAFRLIF